jgi:hypothetical protein
LAYRVAPRLQGAEFFVRRVQISPLLSIRLGFSAPDIHGIGLRFAISGTRALADRR